MGEAVEVKVVILLEHELRAAAAAFLLLSGEELGQLDSLPAGIRRVHATAFKALEGIAKCPGAAITLTNIEGLTAPMRRRVVVEHVKVDAKDEVGYSGTPEYNRGYGYADCIIDSDLEAPSSALSSPHKSGSEDDKAWRDGFNVRMAEEAGE